MGTRTTIRRLLGAATGVAVLALAACTPQPAPPPPSTGPTSVSGCGPTEDPSASNPVQYVAVVDEPGPGTPEVETFTATSKEDKDAKVKKLAKRGTLVAVDEDEPVAALVDGSDDPRVPEQWGLTNSNFSGAWTSGFDGTGITIAIIDTGVSASHQDLAGKVLQGIDYYAGSDASPAGDSDYGRTDAHGHGTHVAGIAAATDNTVGGLGGAPGAAILPVRVLGPSGGGSSSDVTSGIYWAVDNGAGVLSLSLGGGGCSSTQKAAVEYAEAHGAVVVAAAGNNGTSGVIYPAGFGSEVIAVGATTQANQKASFSNWGSPYVDIGAPGDQILSTYPFAGSSNTFPPSDTNYRLMSGTSMATPFVSAAVALVLQHCPAITNGSANGSSVKDKVMALLQSTANPTIPGLGAKLLQAGAATAAACPA